jgi:tetratricopeptide (TPR) repeat protein
MNRARNLVTLLLTLAVATAAHASWYDDYDAGIAAARAGNWNVVVAKMNAAIKGNPKEGNKTRTYGAIFINYHPYYYRGVGYLNTGKYQQAIDDLERTSGPGPENLGSIGELLDRAKRQLASSVPDPDPVRPVTEPVRPTPATPTAPAIDSALRDRARSALAGANRKLQQAQQRRAGSSPQYQQAASLFNDASGRIAAVKSNDDLNTIITMAENAGDLADLAMPPNAPTPPPAIVNNTPSAPVPTKPSVAADSVLESYKPRLRRALENYFAGEFDAATRDFEALTRELPTNGWIWAFLGASQYSQYAFEAEESYRAAAVRSFKKAKSLRRWSGGLPDKYFSKRIRRAFNEVG